MLKNSITGASQAVISSDLELKSRFFGDITVLSMGLTCDVLGGKVCFGARLGC
jgi:hypothetical protein